MKIIGITGQSGSGKGYLSTEFAKLGYIHADADKIYHDLLKNCTSLKDELVRTFGADILTNGEIDRKILGKKVFGANNARKLAKLNKITHKYVCREYIKLIVALKEQDSKGIIIDAPLLIEARLHKLCDFNIYVYCDEEVRIERIMKRDSISREAALLRIRSQKPWSFYATQCDTAIPNNGILPLDDYAKSIDNLLHGESNE
ncbi:MAG: dephospho-CoA kinase [Clostridia bacterium]|nr:dephospho-CoA kinase [Clostridia bacterium]